eukprot:3352222-Prymnesium_polylepis.1
MSRSTRTSRAPELSDLQTCVYKELLRSCYRRPQRDFACSTRLLAFMRALSLSLQPESRAHALQARAATCDWLGTTRLRINNRCPLLHPRTSIAAGGIQCVWHSVHAAHMVKAHFLSSGLSVVEHQSLHSDGGGGLGDGERATTPGGGGEGDGGGGGGSSLVQMPSMHPYCSGQH